MENTKVELDLNIVRNSFGQNAYEIVDGVMGGKQVKKILQKANMETILHEITIDSCGKHLCSRCNNIYYADGPTTLDENGCIFAYEQGVEREDNGGGYWITSCPNYKPLNHREVYSAWIRSDKWKQIAKNAVKRADFRCERCRTAKNLCVHHITYDHLGSEDFHPEDLVVLCRNCHEEIHSEDLKRKKPDTGNQEALDHHIEESQR